MSRNSFCVEPQTFKASYTQSWILEEVEDMAIKKAMGTHSRDNNNSNNMTSLCLERMGHLRSRWVCLCLKRSPRLFNVSMALMRLRGLVKMVNLIYVIFF